MGAASSPVFVVVAGSRDGGAWRVVAPLNRPNPSDVATLRPKWHALDGARTPSKHVRQVAKGKSGVYAFRHRATGRVLYVGESHTDRLWKTMLRHLQPGDRASCAKKSVGGKKRKGGCLLFEDVGEWTYKGARADLDVAVWIVEKGRAVALEMDVIERLDPLHNDQGEEGPGGF